MRAIWKGAITFGLVNVPVKVYSATEDHDLSLHQVHDVDGGRIRYQRRCEVCDKVVEYRHIDKAYEQGSTTVVLTEDDLKSLPEEHSREIEVVEFVPSDQVDPIMFERSYFLEPDSKSLKAYALLRRALEETDRTAIVQFSLRQKTRLGALRSRSSGGSKVLMLQSLLWDDEVREADFPGLREDVRVSAQELKMAGSLIDKMATDFAPDKFGDDYQEQLRQLIDAKIKEGDALDTAATFGEQPEESDGGGEVIDLMEALRQSVERNRGKRSSRSTDPATASADKTDREPASKKPGATKTAATQTATEKAAVKKTAAKKTATKKTATGRSAKPSASGRSAKPNTERKAESGQGSTKKGRAKKAS
jgi:DNA end-binding protein Ku